MNLLNLPDIEWLRASFSGHQEIFYVGPSFYYKLIMLLVLCLIMIDQVRKIRRIIDYSRVIFIQRSFIITGAFLLMTPTLHPWYLLWIVPFLIFIPNIAWLLFTYLIQFSYAVLSQYAVSGEWQESLYILLAQYIPFYIILIWEFLDQRRIKGWLIFSGR
jgi:hypothetical protein